MYSEILTPVKSLRELLLFLVVWGFTHKIKKEEMQANRLQKY